MFAIFSLVVLLAVLPALFAVENPAAIAFKTLEQINAKLLPTKMTKPLNSTDSSYALIHYFDQKDCSTAEIQYVAYKTGVCYTAGDGLSSRWSCNGDTAHFDSFGSVDCSGTSTSGGDFAPNQCFPQDQATGYVLATSFSCASSYVPAGSWYSTLLYTDSGCKDMYMASHMKNGYCMPLGTYSMKYDYPKEYYYMTSGTCSGTPYIMDLSSTVNHCYPGTTGTTQSSQMLYLTA